MKYHLAKAVIKGVGWAGIIAGVIGIVLNNVHMIALSAMNTATAGFLLSLYNGEE